MTLMEPIKPNVNHNFRTTIESAGNDEQKWVETHQEKDHN